MKGNPNIEDKSVRVVWRKLDKDNSGKLKYDELVDYLGAGAKKASAAEQFIAPGMSNACKTFCTVFASLTINDEDGKAARAHAWSACDPNGNGYVSLAESDGWLQKVLINYMAPDKDEAIRIWKCFRPSYIRAFNDAKDVAGGGKKKGRADDYVTKSEFRVLFSYFILYAGMYDAFALIDGGGGDVEDKTGDDRRMFLEEWLKGYKNVGDHGFVGLKEAAGLDPKAAEGLFKEMNSGRDADGKEYGKDNCVMLAEFCAWVEKKEIEKGTEMGKLLAL